MAATLEELERRLSTMEQELAAVRLAVSTLDARAVASQGPGRPRRVDRAQAELSAGWAKAMEQMGIRAKPLGAERLQAMILAEGADPRDNSCSRGIVEMREE